MAIWDLDSRSVYGHPSMSPYDQKIKQLIDATPFWEKDGGGIRGRTIAPLLGGSSGSNTMEEALPQQFNQQTNRSFTLQEEILPDLILPAIGGGRGSVAHPWKISLRTVPESDPPQYEFKVELNSALYSGLGSFSNSEVIGLDFWAPASEGYLYLFGVIEDGECTEGSIQGPAEIPSDRIEFIDGEQNSFSAIIGYIYEGENGSLIVKQDAFHNFTLIQTCIDGNIALYPFAT
jgi:hypothetical protein